MKIDFCLKKISFIYKFTFHSKIIERNFNFNLLVLSFIKFNCAAANPTALELLLLQVKWWILSNWQERNELPPLRKGVCGTETAGVAESSGMAGASRFTCCPDLEAVYPRTDVSSTPTVYRNSSHQNETLMKNNNNNNKQFSVLSICLKNIGLRK